MNELSKRKLTTLQTLGNDTADYDIVQSDNDVLISISAICFWISRIYEPIP